MLELWFCDKFVMGYSSFLHNTKHTWYVGNQIMSGWISINTWKKWGILLGLALEGRVGRVNGYLHSCIFSAMPTYPNRIYLLHSTIFLNWIYCTTPSDQIYHDPPLQDRIKHEPLSPRSIHFWPPSPPPHSY